MDILSYILGKKSSAGLPLEATTANAMWALCKPSNVGKCLKYTGTTGEFTNGDLYIVDQAVSGGACTFTHYGASATKIYPYLCFTAEQANSTVSTSITGTMSPVPELEYSTNGTTWYPFVLGSTTVTLANIGDKMYLRGNNDTFNSGDAYARLTMTGKIAGSGNIMSLLDKTCQSVTIGAEGVFYELFFNCTSLTSAPELPATTLTEGCYMLMFYGCTSLITAPELPSTTVESFCYCQMFQNCTSLTTAPELPATTLADYCYYGMLRACPSLETAPELPATTLADYCYFSMFYSSTSLNYIKIDYTGAFNAVRNAFGYWVYGVSATGDFYYNGDDTTRGTSAIPEGWTVHTF